MIAFRLFFSETESLIKKNIVMRPRYLAMTLTFMFLISGLCLASWIVCAEQPQTFVPNKALYAKILRFGKEAYMRARYLDAKQYFRKAVQADPTSQTPWRYYDQAVIFGLAERVEFRDPFMTGEGEVDFDLAHCPVVGILCARYMERRDRQIYCTNLL